jgi:hypothetical protein
MYEPVATYRMDLLVSANKLITVSNVAALASPPSPVVVAVPVPAIVVMTPALETNRMR